MKGKNTRPNNAQRYERKFPIGYKELLQLSREDPNVIQFRIACQSSSFPKLLRTVNGKPGTVELAVSMTAQTIYIKTCLF